MYNIVLVVVNFFLKVFMFLVDCHSKTIVLCHACSLSSFFLIAFQNQDDNDNKENFEQEEEDHTPSLDES